MEYEMAERVGEGWAELATPELPWVLQVGGQCLRVCIPLVYPDQDSANGNTISSSEEALAFNPQALCGTTMDTRRPLVSQQFFHPQNEYSVQSRPDCHLLKTEFTNPRQNTPV